ARDHEVAVAVLREAGKHLEVLVGHHLRVGVDVVDGMEDHRALVALRLAMGRTATSPTPPAAAKTSSWIETDAPRRTPPRLGEPLRSARQSTTLAPTSEEPSSVLRVTQRCECLDLEVEVTVHRA